MARTKGAKNKVSNEVKLLMAQINQLEAEKLAWIKYSKALLEIIIDTNINKSEVNNGKDIRG